MNWSEQDLRQFKKKGIRPETIDEQIRVFSRGIPCVQLVRPATGGDGIHCFAEEEINRYLDFYEKNRPAGIVKFVPSSGAATRMFKDLFACEVELENRGAEAFNRLEKENPLAYRFFHDLEKFPFFDELTRRSPGIRENILSDVSTALSVLRFVLYEEGLNYGNLPKGLIDFHKYGSESRTPFEEHLVEGAGYAAGSGKKVRIHFTVSPEHRKGFEDLFLEVKDRYEQAYDVHLEVEFSEQDPSTDTLAVETDNSPFRNPDGTILFRPGGHGALIHNLNAIEEGLVFIKNIDNVVPDSLKSETFRFKKLLGGFLLEKRERIFSFLRRLDEGEAAEPLFGEITEFLENVLFIRVPAEMLQESVPQKAAWYRRILDRPIRVCGMVKNEGEPGGGPFFVCDAAGNVSLQIVEKAQINTRDPEQQQIAGNSTHFNPVDLVCGTTNYKGEKYDLTGYIDPGTGFISHKSKDGRDLKAMELPGLWNGAMAFWNTLFVEVPLITFNPVKTINDLLRPQHQ